MYLFVLLITLQKYHQQPRTLDDKSKPQHRAEDKTTVTKAFVNTSLNYRRTFLANMAVYRHKQTHSLLTKSHLLVTVEKFI